MDDCFKESMRKLAVWYTKTFKPIMTHDELEPIMVTLGFIGFPPAVNGAGVSWKEYKHSADGCRSTSEEIPPKPRLPFPRIDGLHIFTYRAFLDAVNFYLEKFDISDLFHIRGMPLYKNHDRNRKWRRMDEESSIFVYREGTLDQTTLNSLKLHKFSLPNTNTDTNNNDDSHNSVSGSKGNDDVTVESDRDDNVSQDSGKEDPSAIRLVRLQDIIPFDTETNRHFRNNF